MQRADGATCLCVTRGPGMHKFGPSQEVLGCAVEQFSVFGKHLCSSLTIQSFSHRLPQGLGGTRNLNFELVFRLNSDGGRTLWGQDEEAKMTSCHRLFTPGDEYQMFVLLLRVFSSIDS